MPIVFTVSDRLHERRLKQKDLREGAGLLPAQASAWVKGSIKRVPLDQLYRISRYLNEPIERLMQVVPD